MIIQTAKHLEHIPELNRPLITLKGIGPKRAHLLSQRGLNTVLDLLFFPPIRYEDRSRVLPINKTVEGPAILVKGRVLFGKEERFLRSGRHLFRIMIKDETANLELLWFHYKRAHLNGFTRQGLELMAYGSVKRDMGKRQMIHPDVILVEKENEKDVLGIYPVYSLIKGISGQITRSAVKQALDKYKEALSDGISKEITHRHGLPGLGETIKNIHFPAKGTPVSMLNQRKTRYHQRLAFDRFFSVMLNIGFRRRAREMKKGPVFSIPKDLVDRFERCLPFTLTGDQMRAVKEILNDLKSGRPMNRLLQGDVGCGKTVVAALTSYAAVYNSFQVAIMVPTQVLARQHYEYFLGLSERMGFSPVLLTGAQTRPERLSIHKKIRNGVYNLIVGTHSLISSDLCFAGLGLNVIDEQHRFGVRQRAMLDKKGANPHLLVMTATPIPRTLAITAYGDMDISVITEYPAGHLPVVTHLVDESRKRKVFNTLRQRMSAGQQAMVICPVIEASEEGDLKNTIEMYEKLRKIFEPRFRVELIHGRLSPYEKDRVMDQFRNCQIDLLVGTTVVEVGIHSPGATVMVIEHPERFGLAQLHQLRGRVGRGAKRGICLLMQSRMFSEESLSRLKILLESNDGFEIAQKDLEMRGQGEFVGIRQSGAGELDFEEMYREPDLLVRAKGEAEKVLESDPELSNPENRVLREMVQSTFTGPVDF